MAEQTGNNNKDNTQAIEIAKCSKLDSIMSPNVLFWASIIIVIILLLLTPIWDETRAKVLWIGVVIALFGCLFAAAVNLRNRIKQHSFELIFRTRFEVDFLNSTEVLRKKYPIYAEIHEEEAETIFNGESSENIELRKAINSLLNFYEILAISIYYNDADEFILRTYFKKIITRFWEQVSELVPLWRADNPDAFVYLQWLADRWNKK